MKRALAAAYLGSIIAANYAIAHVGAQPDQHGPHVLPVGFGLMAPSGVYVVGLTLVLRDLVQRQSGDRGKRVAFALILVGAVLTIPIAPSFALASATAFLLSESADFGVFSALERFGKELAVIASNAVGLVVDTLVFLSVAFGSLTLWQGQMVGKSYATAAFLVWVAAPKVLTWVRSRRTVTA